MPRTRMVGRSGRAVARLGRQPVSYAARPLARAALMRFLRKSPVVEPDFST